jgi:hypothetical protein
LACNQIGAQPKLAGIQFGLEFRRLALKATHQDPNQLIRELCSGAIRILR